MFRRIKDFLYAVTHASGRLFDLTAELGLFQLSLWVGREDPDAVNFAVEASLTYGRLYGGSSLAVAVEVGVIKVELYLTRN